jgi:DNA-directed RNA polymerase subunit RPC12/RpoP
MSNDVREVKCPFCGETLLRRGEVAPGVGAKTVDSPEIEQDAKGDFMNCPHCSRRVAMERITSDAGFPAIRLASNQKQEP